MKEFSRMQMLMSNRMRPIYCWSLVALLCVIIPIISAADEILVLNGRFETSDGSQCTWFELKLSLNKSAMGMACRCNKEPQGRQSYTCRYEVEAIERCSEYQTHPRSFYNGLVKQITGKLYCCLATILPHILIVFYMC